MKMIKKIAALVLSVVLAITCLAACGSSGYTADNTEFVIGLTGPLTGGAAMYGTAVKNSAQMAVDEINEAGGIDGMKFKLVAYDDMHDATKVATNYSAMIEAGMQVSLGAVTTNPGLEFKNLSLDDNVFFLTPSASGDAIPANENGYQMCFADGNQGTVAAEYIKENLSDKKIGAFYKSDDAYSKGIFDNFKKALGDSYAIVETSFTEANTTDFASQIDKLKDCDLIFMPIYYTPASLFMTQAKDIVAKDAIYYGCDGFDGIDNIKGFDITSIPQEVSMLSHFNSKATEGKAKEFIDKYVAAHGKETLNQFGASAYDCVYAIYGAMKAAYEADQESISVTMSPSDLCEVLKGQFNGGYTLENAVTGDKISWESTGYVNKAAIMYVVKAATK